MLYLLFGLIWPLIYACCMLGIGIISVFNNPLVLHLIGYFGAVMLPLRGLLYIFYSLIKGSGVTKGMIIQSCAEILLGAAIVALPNYSYGAFVVLLEIFTSFYAEIKLIDALIYGKNGQRKYMIPSIAQAALFFHIFMVILLAPGVIRRRVVEISAGITLALFGMAHICDLLAMLIKNQRMREILSSIRVTMSGFVALGISHKLLHTIKNAEIRADANDVNLEVFFRFGRSGIEFAGHCEICMDGKTYTYGNYDPSSRKLFGTVGKGVIVRADRDEYIDWCLNGNRKTIIAYGLCLNESEMALVRQRAKEFDAALLPWNDEAHRLPEREYARRLIENVACDEYRIASGRFKTYFIPTINCTKLVDYFLRDTAIGHTIIPGVYSPGAYMDVLQRLYDSGSKTVVSLKKYGI